MQADADGRLDVERGDVMLGGKSGHGKNLSEQRHSSTGKHRSQDRKII